MEGEKLKELPYERIAMSGGEMPDGLEWYDRQMFLCLRELYHQHKIGMIDRETARREKIRLLDDYEFKKWQENWTANIADLLKRTETARRNYRNNRTLENADAVIFAFEGVPVTFNEEVF